MKYHLVSRTIPYCVDTVYQYRTCIEVNEWTLLRYAKFMNYVCHAMNYANKAWQWAETLVEITETLADIRRTTK